MPAAPFDAGRAHARRGIQSNRDDKTGGVTTTKTELSQAAKLSDEAGPPQLQAYSSGIGSADLTPPRSSHSAEAGNPGRRRGDRGSCPAHPVPDHPAATSQSGKVSVRLKRRFPAPAINLPDAARSFGQDLARQRQPPSGVVLTEASTASSSNRRRLLSWPRHGSAAAGASPKSRASFQTRCWSGMEGLRTERKVRRAETSPGTRSSSAADIPPRPWRARRATARVWHVADGFRL